MKNVIQFKTYTVSFNVVCSFTAFSSELSGFCSTLLLDDGALQHDDVALESKLM